MLDSYSPWWCHPDTIPASVVTKPAHIPSVATACSRVIPAWGHPRSVRWAGRAAFTAHGTRSLRRAGNRSLPSMDPRHGLVNGRAQPWV